MSATREQAQMTLQMWAKDFQAHLDLLQQVEPEVLARGIAAIVQPDPQKSSRSDFADQLQAADSLSTLNRLIEQRIDQVGEPQMLRELGRIAQRPQ